MNIGGFFNTIFTYPIFNVLLLLYRLFGDFGLSIIVLTIMIRLILFPLTVKQLKSQKAMQAIQPQMAEIRKKYPKDRQAQYQEIQALQKAYGVRPLAGCLPLVIQLPVLYGLFFALNTVLRSPNLAYINSVIYPFLPHFHSLSQLNTSLNWFGFLGVHINLGVPDPTHVLPILAGLATFIQLRMSQLQTANTAGSKDAMATQMKTMQYIMPLITVFIGWNFAAGLALYWTTSTIFAIVQQYLITGWGSLFELPSFLGGKTATSSSTSNGSSKTYSGDSRKERQLISKASAKEEQETEAVASNGAVTRNGGTNGYASDESTARRRPRSNSASARRRGNAPKRNASRR